MLKIREAIILAAGYGTRIKSVAKNVPKPLIRIFNIPLIAYPIANLLRIGVKKFYIVVNPQNYSLIAKFLLKTNVNFKLIVNSLPERGNGLSLLLAMKHVVDEKFYLTMSDHIHDPAIFDTFSKYPHSFDVVVGADSRPKLIDEDEATKIVATNHHVRDIGKDIYNYTHVDIGLFIMSKRLLKEYRLYSDSFYDLKLSNLIRYVISKNYNVVALDIHGRPWIDIDTAEDLDRVKGVAKGFIVRTIHKLSRQLKRINLNYDVKRNID